MKPSLPATSIATVIALDISLGSRNVDLEVNNDRSELSWMSSLALQSWPKHSVALRRQPEHQYVRENSGMETISYGVIQIYSDSHR
jgi:hypothetical protein